MTVAALALVGGSRTLHHALATDQPTAQVATETAILAGGCFWGMEEILRKIPA